MDNFEKTILFIRRKIDELKSHIFSVKIENQVDIQRVEVVNHKEDKEDVIVSNLDYIKEPLEKSLANIASILEKQIEEKKESKGEEYEESVKLLESINKIYTELSSSDIASEIIPKLEEIKKGIEEKSFSIDLSKIESGFESLFLLVDLLGEVKRFDRLKVELPDKQIEKMAKSITIASSSNTSHTRNSAGAIINPATEETLSAVAGLVTNSYDYISVAYPGVETEVYTYKDGGAGGTTVATVTVVYTDSTKQNLSTVMKV